MKILIFDLIGKVGHFRKIDTNSSSLSYSFPPRTTIVGLLAGILGMERDSYYQLFSPEQCNVAVSCKTPVRKVMQTMNYMFVKSKSDLNNSKGHTQIPVEFLFSDGQQENLRYRIYFSHSDSNVYEEVKRRLQTNRYVYPPYLGLSELLGHLEWIAEADCAKQTSETPVAIHSVCRIQDLRERSLIFDRTSRYTKEFMTRQFTDKRMIGETSYYLSEKSGCIRGIPTESYFSVSYGEQNENLLFM